VGATLAVLVAAGPASAEGGWREPLRIGDFAAKDRPALALHGDDPYIAVAGGPGARGIHLLSKAGGAWLDTRITTKRDRQPSIAIRHDGVIHIAFSRRGRGCDESPCTKGIYHATDASGEWIVRRVHAGQRDVHPSIALDASGRPWIHFRQGNALAEASRFGGEWASFKMFSACCGPDRLEGPEMVIWGFDRITASRRQFDGGEVVLGIAEFDNAFQIRLDRSDEAHDPDLVRDSNDSFGVAYRRTGDGLWHAAPDADGRIERTRVAAAEVRPPSIAALPDGSVIIVAATDAGLIYRTDAAGSWRGGKITSAAGGFAPDVATTARGGIRAAFLREGPDGSAAVWLSRHPRN